MASDRLTITSIKPERRAVWEAAAQAKERTLSNWARLVLDRAASEQAKPATEPTTR